MFDLFLNPEPNAKFILPTGYLDKAWVFNGGYIFLFILFQNNDSK